VAKREVDPLNESGVDVPSPWGQDLHDLSPGTEHHLWTHVDQVAAAVLFDDLGIEQLRAWHPTGLWDWPFGLTAGRQYPVPQMGQESGRILLKAVGEKEGYAAWG
jgi:hypothetical protein